MGHDRFRAVPVPKVAPDVRVKSFTEVSLGYSEEDAVREASRCLGCRTPFCVDACPIQQDARGYVRALSEGRFDAALATIFERNPLPGVMGRVCDHQCQSACPMGKRGDAVNICPLKRAASDLGEYTPEVEGGSRGSVAIVGSGPSGLVLAYLLARRGVRVTIFESLPVAGGVLSIGIPRYRLPRDVVSRDIRRILELGVELEVNRTVGKDVPLDELRKAYDAVYIGVGATVGRMLGVPGEDLPGVYHALDLLREVNTGGSPRLGARTAVIGAGLVAADAVRTARRLGSESFILYRRTRAEMPMTPEEKHEIEEEGILLMELLTPVEFVGDGRLERIVCERMKLGEPDASGRRRPLPTGDHVEVEADSAIISTGQRYDATVFTGSEMAGKLDPIREKAIPVDDRCMFVDGVYVGGDAAFGASTVANAARSAHIVAGDILARLGL